MALIDHTTRTIHFNRPTRANVSISKMIDVWRSRRALSRLDTHLLQDIGLNAKSAAKEEAKPIWDVPTTWHN